MTRSQLRTALFAYIETFYNRQRHQARLGHRTPADVYDEHAARNITNPCPRKRGNSMTQVMKDGLSVVDIDVDGRTVTCVVYTRTNLGGLSCDWRN